MMPRPPTSSTRSRPCRRWRPSSVAEQLGITPEKAKRLLDEFIELCLNDLGDLRGRLTGVVDLV